LFYPCHVFLRSIGGGAGLSSAGGPRWCHFDAAPVAPSDTRVVRPAPVAQAS
jgi:hypothetical protein